MRRRFPLALVFLGLLGCSEESTKPETAVDSVAEQEPADVIEIPADIKVSIYFGDHADSMGIYADGRGHIVTKDYLTIEKQWTSDEYRRIRSLCMNVINKVPVTNERAGGPGYESVSIMLGNGTSASFTHGIVKPQEFPTEVQDLLKAVLEMQAETKE